MTVAPPAALQSRATRRDTAPPARPVSTTATAGQRAGAYLIDVTLVILLAVAVWFFSNSLILVGVVVIELWVIGWIWEGHTGGSPGNLIYGIRTVRKNADVSLGARGLFLRSLAVGAAHVLPVLLPVGLTASGVLDGLADARVIDVRKPARAREGVTPQMPDLEARVSGTEVGAAGQAVITRTPLSTPASPGPTPAPVEVAIAVPPAEPMPIAGTVPVFVLTDGTTIRATGLGFIGRAPRAPESIPEAILVRVPDGARSLSRTHAAFGVEEGELWVQDLGSANGASVRHLGGGETPLTPHTPYFLVAGDVLVLGGDAELAFRRIVDRGPRAAAVVVAHAAPADFPAPPSSEPALGLAPPAPAEPPLPAPPAGASTIAFQFQDGTTVPILGVGYIGRAPSLPPGERADAALVAVPDGDRSVSRTHGRFGLVDAQAWFEDLGSGNGSSLRTGDGRSGPMTPHQRFGLVPGMVLQLGDCIIRVVAA